MFLCILLNIKEFCFLQQTREEKEILDGPKIITVPAKLDGNPAYSLLISDLVPGLTYEIKVSYPIELLFKRVYNPVVESSD